MDIVYFLHTYCYVGIYSNFTVMFGVSYVSYHTFLFNYNGFVHAHSVHFVIPSGVTIDLYWRVFHTSFTPNLFGSVKMDYAVFAKSMHFIVKAVS